MKIIHRNEIFAVDRQMFDGANYITLHLIGRTPVKIALDRIVWFIFPENHPSEDRFSITENSAEFESPLYHISGFEREIQEFAKSIGLTMDIFDEERKEG